MRRRTRCSSKGDWEEEKEEGSHVGNNGSVNLEREGDGEKMGEKERRGSQINVVKISSVAWLCLGIILGMADMKFNLRFTRDLYVMVSLFLDN